MWLYTKIGFFSAVEDRTDPKRDMLLVRARFRGDIERMAEEAGIPHSQIIETPDRDYLYRVRMSKALFSRIVKKLCQQIDYGNFKSAIHGEPARDRAYTRAWQALAEAQADEALTGIR